jgi:multisubunit Na+/H+ antiporter MnhB subunit
MRKELSVLILVILAVFLFIMAAGFTFGSPLKTDMDDYFIRNGQEQIAANNIVTTVVFDYRGFDTLGESTVLFTAVIGVALIFRKIVRGDSDENE